MEHDFIRRLKEGHEKQRTLGRQLVEATEARERERLRWQLYREIYPHMVGEEASIFPFMQKSGDEGAREGALKALQEHHLGQLLLGELMKLGLESEVFKAKVKVLDEVNRQHLTEEEEKHFLWLQGNCSQAQLGELFERYRKAEEKERD